MAAKKMAPPSGARVEPRELAVKTREIAQLCIREMAPLGGITKKFIAPHYNIRFVDEPAPGYEISLTGEAIYVPMSAVEFVKYNRE